MAIHPLYYSQNHPRYSIKSCLNLTLYISPYVFSFSIINFHSYLKTILFCKARNINHKPLLQQLNQPHFHTSYLLYGYPKILEPYFYHTCTTKHIDSVCHVRSPFIHRFSHIQAPFIYYFSYQFLINAHTQKHGVQPSSLARIPLIVHPSKRRNHG